MYVEYHDREWGVPERDDGKLFEFLVLEGAQAGLSWISILRRREEYRRAFDGFDPERIARYDEKKIESLLQDRGIIRKKAMNIDLLSMAAHKFYGPKGVGALYIRKGVRIDNFIHGGGQEKGRRATTENVAGIVGMGKAIELASDRMKEASARIARLRDMLVDGVLKTIPHSKLNGAPSGERLPNNANFSFIGIEGETLLLDLDRAGIYGSTGSACSSGSLDPSHVLMAIGLSHELAHGSLRLTLGEETTEDDIKYVLETLPGIVAHRREMSPLWEDYLKSL